MSSPTKRPRKPPAKKPSINPSTLAKKKLLTAHEVAYLLSMSYRTVLEYTKRINPITREPYLKHGKVGNQFRFTQSAVDACAEQLGTMA